jgi:hypothetical protein
VVGAVTLMKPEYLALVAVVIPSVATFVLAFWEESPRWVRRTAAFATLFSAFLAGFAALWISNESAALITGGDSFCYVVNEGVPNPPFPAVVFKSGEYPLYDVHMRIVNLIEPFRPLQVSPGSKPFDLGITLQLGDFPIGGAAREIEFPLPAKGDRASFNVFFDAHNGFWIENLRLRLVKGEWRKAIQVFRSLPNKKEQYLYKETDKGFPTESDGNVKW